MNIQWQKTTLATVAHNSGQFPARPLPEIVLAGRSNVGKSSLINRLIRQKNLARTSQTPGKTRQIIFFNVDNNCYLVDLPGYGYAKVSQREKLSFAQLIDSYLSAQRPIALMLLLLDCRITPTEQDRQMLSWLEQSGFAWRIVLTKTDKLSRSALGQRRQFFVSFFDLADENEIIPFSARTGAGIDILQGVLNAALER